VIGIVKYGVVNVGSIVNVLKKISVDHVVISDPDQLIDCTSIVLPGVGSFDNAMGNLTETGMDEALVSFHRTGKDILGICLGMQLLTQGSAEGAKRGLRLMDDYCIRFNDEDPAGHKVPHMGWSYVKEQQEHYYLKGSKDVRFYFAHSYYMPHTTTNEVLLYASYGIDFAAMIRKDNVVGCQFHPEKSHRFGLALLSNYFE
jgi:imidazole glycerol-phosphate synthase subunit HisH